MAKRLKNLRRKKKLQIHVIEKRIINKKFIENKVLKLLKLNNNRFRLYDLVKYINGDVEYHYRYFDEGVWIHVNENGYVEEVIYLPF